ncbi:MAG: hypothetical protein GVY26_09490 [Bacteroidetes bacterium]|jgi:hypothetical protein|nr:hypothetical protein [Bacteroidota bacterium]
MKTWITYCGAIGLAVLLNACGGAERVDEQAEKGIVTTVREVKDGEFKIEDEQMVEEKSASAIIAKYADNTTDTIPLSEAKQLMQDSTAAQASQDTTHRRHHHYRRRTSLLSIAAYGYMGYMLGRNRSSFSPRPSAYMDRSTYQRVNNTTGTRFRNATSRSTTSRPSKGKSGYGGSRSTRSYGG